MIEEYPEIALERFDKANFWIKYIILHIKKFLIDEFPNSKDYYDQTEEKIEKI